MAAAVAHERRAAPRVSTSGSDGIGSAKLRPGRTAYVLDVSAGGALIETDWRLLPGARVEVQLGDPTPLYKVTGRILRCHVALLDRERIRYRGAVAFDQRLAFGEHATPRVEPGT
ncbi:MAG TPA: PilZ domain-containing protein [Vicinamibacterales bacterium]|nr:PilZ domain-containing protein [Vicinamibacterales bacterium]